MADMTMRVQTGVNTTPVPGVTTPKETAFEAKFNGDTTYDNAVRVGGQTVFVDDAALKFLQEQGLVEAHTKGASSWNEAKSKSDVQKVELFTGTYHVGDKPVARSK